MVHCNSRYIIISKHLIFPQGHHRRAVYWLTVRGGLRGTSELPLNSTYQLQYADAEQKVNSCASHFIILFVVSWSCSKGHFVFSLKVRHLIPKEQVVAIHFALQLVAVVTHIALIVIRVLWSHHESLTSPATPFCVDSITWNNNTVLEAILSIAFSSFIHSSSPSGCCVYIQLLVGVSSSARW